MAAATRLAAQQLDGRSVYARPGAARYATAAQLSLEERLVAQAQAQDAPRVRGQLAARRLGADLAQLHAALPAARTARTGVTRRAGCGWTRWPQPGARSPRLAPSK